MLRSSYESVGLPRGGGRATNLNILLCSFILNGLDLATGFTQDSGDNGSFVGSSNRLVDDVAFVNFTECTNASQTSDPRGNEVSVLFEPASVLQHQ